MNKAYDFLMKEVNLKYGDSVVIGCSGGPDSMALLHLMVSVKQALDIEIICAHVNHNTGRQGQIEEQNAVEKYCRNNNIIFETMIIEDYGDDNFHNEARSKRYNYFSTLIEKYRAKYLLTAHHGDDLIETILMRIVRGSTLRGYSGFSKVVQMNNYQILRPLIEVTKEEILIYNKKNKVKFMTDSSNSKDVYTRNRFRKYIVPALKHEDINVHSKFYKYSKTLIEYNDYIDNQVKKIIKHVYPQNVINIEEFNKLEHVIAIKVIYYILEHIYQDDLMLITDHHAELIYNLINSKKPNTYIYLPNNLKAIKSYNNLSFLQEEIKADEYEIEIINYLSLPNNKNIELVESSNDKSNNICRLDSSDLEMPLRVRTRKVRRCDHRSRIE